jgi:hypothetical protein
VVHAIELLTRLDPLLPVVETPATDDDGAGLVELAEVVAGVRVVHDGVGGAAGCRAPPGRAAANP